MNVREFALGKSVEEYEFWGVVFFYSWPGPCFRSSDDNEVVSIWLEQRAQERAQTPGQPFFTSRSPPGIHQDPPTAGLRCNSIHSSVPHCSWAFPCPRGLPWLGGEPMGTSCPPFSLAHPVSVHLLFFPSLRFLSCPWCRALQSSPRDLRYTSTLTLAGRAERVTAPVAALAGRGVHVFHPFLSACVHVWKILTHFFPSGFSCWLLFLWVGHSRVSIAKSSW